MNEQNQTFNAEKVMNINDYSLKIQLSEDGKKVRYKINNGNPSDWQNLMEGYDYDVPEDIEPQIRKSFMADGMEWFVDEFEDI